ncbi:MAG: ATP-binding protein, partial [Candidatus Faecivicinus sp.]
GSRSGVSDGSRSMGIGLSVCKAIILAHGGGIEAENLPEGGACFRFRLPMKEEHYESNDDHSDRGGR